MVELEALPRQRMNWDTIERHWKQVAAKAQKRPGENEADSELTGRTASPARLAGGEDPTFQQDIDSYRERIARAVSERDAWRTAGREEQYLEACFLVDALELQRDERLLRHKTGWSP